MYVNVNLACNLKLLVAATLQVTSVHRKAFMKDLSFSLLSLMLLWLCLYDGKVRCIAGVMVNRLHQHATQHYRYWSGSVHEMCSPFSTEFDERIEGQNMNHMLLSVYILCLHVLWTESCQQTECL